MPRRRVVVTEAVNGSPGLAWDSDQPCEVETPPHSPTRQSSNASTKGSSLRRSLSRTLSSLFRSSSSSSSPSKQPSPMLKNGNSQPTLPPEPPSPQPTVLRESPSPERQESSATLPRLYQKRSKQVTPSGPLGRRKSNRRDDAKSASCTRISDIPAETLETSRSHSNITEGSDSTGPTRRWNSTMNTSRRTDNGKLRISSTFIRKSMENNLDYPVSPSVEDMAVFDEVDGPVDHPRHSWTRHKPRPRQVKRAVSRVERKEAYSSSEVRSRPSSMSGSTTTLTRLARKAPVAIIADL